MDFLEALNQRVLVCDGGMGSVLYARGVFVNQSFEALNLRQPELVTAVHAAYVQAGADLIESNTFGANRLKLAGFDLVDELAAINWAGVRIAREAGAPFVAGALGPLGVPVGADGGMSREAAAEAFDEQAAALVEAGADLLLLETFSRVAELRVAVETLRRRSTLPIVAQVSIAEDGLTQDHVTPEECARGLTEAGATVVGVNCGEGPAATLESVERLADATAAPLSAQPNAGAAREVEGRRLSLSSPDFLASYVRRFVTEGVGIVGGCCGTGPEHIARIAETVSGLAAPRRVEIPADVSS